MYESYNVYLQIAGEHGVTAYIAPDQYAVDFIELFKVRDKTYKNNKKVPYIFGVDNSPDIKWMNQFMLNMTEYDHVLDAFTWHSYPLGAGKSPQVDEEIMNPLFRQKVAHTASEIQHADWNSLLPKGIWMGETGGAYNSGRNTVTNRFMSAFWYLDWLGTLSKVRF